mgnify:CR=1 FL=1
MYCLRFGFWFNELLGNFGFFDLRYQKIWLYYFPGLYILSVAIKNNYFRLINIYSFLIFYIFHYLMESYLYKELLPNAIYLLPKVKSFFSQL